MENSSYEHRKELLRLLNVRVDLVREEDCHRLDMSCDLPKSKHSEVLGLCRSYSSNKFDVTLSHIRITSSMHLPMGKEKPDYKSLADALFSRTIINESERVINTE